MITIVVMDHLSVIKIIYGLFSDVSHGVTQLEAPLSKFVEVILKNAKLLLTIICASIKGTKRDVTSLRPAIEAAEPGFSIFNIRAAAIELSDLFDNGRIQWSHKV